MKVCRQHEIIYSIHSIYNPPVDLHCSRFTKKISHLVETANSTFQGSARSIFY